MLTIHVCHQRNKLHFTIDLLWKQYFQIVIILYNKTLFTATVVSFIYLYIYLEYKILFIFENMKKNLINPIFDMSCISTVHSNIHLLLIDYLGNTTHAETNVYSVFTISCEYASFI